MSAAALWLSGFILGAVGGWLAARYTRRRTAHAHDATDGPGAGAQQVRAADAAADLPPGAQFETLCHMLADRASEQVALPCMVVLRDVTGGPIKITAVSANYDSRLAGMFVAPDSWAGRAVTDGLAVVAPEDEPVLPLDSGDRRRPVRGGVAIPIISATRVEGAVLALGESRVSSGETIARLEQLCRRFAPVLGPAHAVFVAERRADTDELTQLANRRALRRAMDGPDARHSALIMLDLDFFKRVNDTLGHPAGDAALKHFAHLLRSELRSGDVAARLGGEEFAVWLPGADLALAMDVAERLRVLVEARPFRYGGEEHPLTVSCGVSACPKPIPSPENLLSTADSALYQAKHMGRNRVVACGGKDG